MFIELTLTGGTIRRLFNIDQIITVDEAGRSHQALIVTTEPSSDENSPTAYLVDEKYELVCKMISQHGCILKAADFAPEPMRCPTCGKDMEPRGHGLECPKCGTIASEERP